MAFLKSDKPINQEIDDRFNRYPFAKRIAETIFNHNGLNGIVFSICGAWGEGKSSILNFIQGELNKNEEILIIRFNPWKFSDVDLLVLNLLKLIAETIGEDLNNNKEKLGDLLQKYGSATSFLGFDLSQIGISLADVDLEKLKERVDEFLQKSDKRLIIFIDDIDRLDSGEIFSLFRLVKLTGDFNKTTYVLSFDKSVVASALNRRFEDGNKDSGEKFLEKIVQVPLEIPKASINAMSSYCLDMLDEMINSLNLKIDEDDLKRFGEAFSNNLLLRIKTPRLANRYVNSLSFSIPLLEGEVDLVDLMLIESIKTFYPLHYYWIKSDPDTFLTSYDGHNYDEKKKVFSSQLEENSSLLDSREKKAIRDLIFKLFPKVEQGFTNIHRVNLDEDLARNKRIGSYRYFNRYLSYSLQDGELSDRLFNSFIESIPDSEITELTTEIRRLMNISSPYEFFSKIQFMDNPLEWESTKKLILSIATIGGELRDGNSIFNFDGERGRGAIVIREALKPFYSKIPKSKIIEFLEQVILTAQPFEFADKIHYWLSPFEKEESILTLDEYTQLSYKLCKRALEESGEENFFEKFPDSSHFLLKSWNHSSNAELVKYLKKAFEKNKNSIPRLLYSITPNGQTLGVEGTYKADFNENSYKFITAIIDKSFLFDKINELYPKIRAEEAKFNGANFEQTELNIMRQFIFWYEKDSE